MKTIYIVVRFPYSYAEHMIKRKAREKEASANYKKGIRAKSKKLEQLTKKELLEYYKRISHRHPDAFGFFSTQGAADKAIENYPEMAEGNYYTYVCVEPTPFGCMEAYALETSSWYRFTGKRYVKCKRPDWSKGVFNFH